MRLFQRSAREVAENCKKNLKIAEKYVRESVQRLKQQLVVIEMDNDLFSMVLKWKKLKMYPSIYLK